MAETKQVSVHFHSGGEQAHSHQHGHAHHNAWLEHALADPKRPARWLLIFSVILLALTAQNFRENFFGLTRPIPSEQVAEQVDFCNQENFLQVCAARAQSKTPYASCIQFNNATSYVSGGQCSCSFDAANEGADCAPNGFKCHLGSCISALDPCNGVICPEVDKCSGPGQCVAGQCVYQADPAFDGELCGSDDVNIGSRCVNGVCTLKTTREITAYAYDASISAGIIISAFALEILLTGSFTPDLAALAINAALINIGWTAKSRDYGLFPNNDALIRTQNAFVFIAGGFAVFFAGKELLKKKGSPSTGLLVVAILTVFVGLVQFGLASQLFGEHFDATASGVVDTNANVAFNWSYNATIYAAMVNIALAFTIIVTGSYSSGFAFFSLVTGLIALAWASNHNDIDSVQGDFSGTALAWISFAIIAGVFSLFVGLGLFFKSKPSGKSTFDAKHKGLAALAVIVFFTDIGLVAGLFDKNFFSNKFQETYGDNFNLVNQNANYGNTVSPFAWPISIWTSAVVVSFAFDVLKGSASTGIAALALTEAANLLGWAANHVYFGSALNSKIEGLSRAWAAVSLTGSIIVIFLAINVLTGDRASQNENHPAEDAPNASDFQNEHKN